MRVAEAMPRVDFDMVVQDPGRYFAGPEEVAHNVAISRRQKIQILERWIGLVSMGREKPGESDSNTVDQALLARLIHTLNGLILDRNLERADRSSENQKSNT